MTLDALAFGMLIGGQFFATIVLISKQASLYSDARLPQDFQERQEPLSHGGGVSARHIQRGRLDWAAITRGHSVEPSAGPLFADHNEDGDEASGIV
jgi:hypothetical protein